MDQLCRNTGPLNLKGPSPLNYRHIDALAFPPCCIKFKVTECKMLKPEYVQETFQLKFSTVQLPCFLWQIFPLIMVTIIRIHLFKPFFGEKIQLSSKVYKQAPKCSPSAILTNV